MSGDLKLPRRGDQVHGLVLRAFALNGGKGHPRLTTLVRGKGEYFSENTNIRKGRIKPAIQSEIKTWWRAGAKGVKRRRQPLLGYPR